MDKPYRKINCGPVDDMDAIRGLGHVVGYMLLHMAASVMDEEGNSSFLNTLVVDVSEQDEDVLPEASKRYVLSLIACIEQTLREEARKRKNGEREKPSGS